MRLQRYLAQCGVAARRKAEQLIVEGRVRVNGAVVDELGARVDPERDRVSVDGKAVTPQDTMYVVLNKPKGFVTTVEDPEGRPTVMELLPRLPVRVVPVGRLDFYSEGVLLLTNDGELAARLLSSRYEVEKTYHVKVRGHVKPAHLRALRQGVRLDDGSITKPAKVDRLPAASKHDWFVVTLTEGKNRQVRRMFEALGYGVTKLQRVAFAGITFHGLRVGDARELSQAEVDALRRLVKLPANTVSRGVWAARREETDRARRARRARAADATREGAAAGRAAHGGRGRGRR
ncbi:MAG: rRNA pseudouridine synthase [Deltaproteobacteria bacterium]|nr:MAG: rRNA pseudouridine synthase [Deltaproteobacteria bacterium]